MYNVLRTVLFQKLQIVHYTSTDVNDVSKSLHWLPIQCEIEFKTLVIVYKTLHCGEHRYIKQYLVPYTGLVNTCQSNPDKKILLTTDYEWIIHSPL